MNSACCCVCLLGLLAAAATPPAPAWGSATNSMTLGIDADSATQNGRLRVHFRNVGPNPIEFGIGGATGVGSMYSVNVTSVAPDGKSCELLDTTVGMVAGAVSPIVIHLAPGATDSISIELRKLICIAGRTTVTLDSLLQQGHSIRAAFTAKADANAWAKVPEGWTGTATSGTFHREPGKQSGR